MKRTTTLFVLAGALLAAAPALAATDYFIKFDGVDGEVADAPPIAVASWSFGTCSAGQCTTVASRRIPAEGRPVRQTRSHPRASVSDFNRTSSGAPGSPDSTDGGAVGDLAAVATHSEVTGFTITVAQMTPTLRKVCNGQHFTGAALSGGTKLRTTGGEGFTITGASLTCSGPRQSAGRAASETAVCNASSCDLSGAVTITFTGGQLKHTKSGHVTLLK